MELFAIEQFELIFRLVVAMGLGLILGTERVFAHKMAGMRTYALVAMGSALFVVIVQVVISSQGAFANFDPLRMASNIAVGLGFIGAGVIIFRGTQVQGLTTAAGIWVAGGIGIATGYGLYVIAVAATLLTLFVFSILSLLERRLKKMSHVWEDDRPQ